MPSRDAVRKKLSINEALERFEKADPLKLSATIIPRQRDSSSRSIARDAWQAVKVIDRSEETEEDGTIVQRERERFTNELTLVFASGETAILR